MTTFKEITDALLDDLYKDNYSKITRELEILIRKNSILRGHQSSVLLYNEEYYSIDETQHFFINPGERVSLHPKLKKEFKNWLSKKNSIDTEKSTVRCYFEAVFRLTEDFEVYETLIPSVLHPTLKKFKMTFPFSDPISPETIQGFLEYHGKYRDVIKQRKALNLITL